MLGVFFDNLGSLLFEILIVTNVLFFTAFPKHCLALFSALILQPSIARVIKQWRRYIR